MHKRIFYFSEGVLPVDDYARPDASRSRLVVTFYKRPGKKANKFAYPHARPRLLSGFRFELDVTEDCMPLEPQLGAGDMLYDFNDG